MDTMRETLEQEIAEMQQQAARLSESDDWLDQWEQALLATAIVLHRNLLAECALTHNAKPNR